MLREQRRRPQQVGADPDVVETRSGRDRATPRALDLERGRAQRQPCRRAGGRRASPLALTRMRGAVSRCSLPFRNCAGASIARQADSGRSSTSSARSAARLPGQIEPRGARPARPAAVAAALRAGSGAWCRAWRPTTLFAGATQTRVEIETVAVGLGVEPEPEPVAAVATSAREVDQGPARADVGLAARGCATRSLPVTALPIRSWSIVQPADMDVELGQDRARLARSVSSLGSRWRMTSFGFELVDHQPVEQPGERAASPSRSAAIRANRPSGS